MTPALATLDVPDHATCLTCGYHLRELTVPRCPECGRQFDPADVMSMNCAGRNAQRRLAHNLGCLPIAAFAVATIVATFLLLSFVYEREGQSPSILLSVLAIGFSARSLVRNWLLSESLTAKERVVSRVTYKSALFLLLFGLLLSISPWQCVHGHGVQIGPFAAVYSDDAGMCWAYVRVDTRVRVTQNISLYMAK